MFLQWRARSLVKQTCIVNLLIVLMVDVGMTKHSWSLSCHRPFRVIGIYWLIILLEGLFCHFCKRVLVKQFSIILIFIFFSLRRMPIDLYRLCLHGCLLLLFNPISIFFLVYYNEWSLVNGDSFCNSHHRFFPNGAGSRLRMMRLLLEFQLTIFYL